MNKQQNTVIYLLYPPYSSTGNFGITYIYSVLKFYVRCDYLQIYCTLRCTGNVITDIRTCIGTKRGKANSLSNCI